MDTFNRIIILFAVLLFLIVLNSAPPTVFAQAISTSTYEAWLFGAAGGAHETTSIKDVSGDGVNDIVISRDKLLHLVDGVTGKKIWSYDSIDFYPWIAVTESPYVNDNGEPDVLAATKNRIFMIDGNAGKQLWNFSIGAPSSNLCFPAVRSVHALSDIDGDSHPDVAVVAGSGDQCPKEDKISVLALSAKDGDKIWDYSYELDYYSLKQGIRGSSPAAAIDLDRDGAKDIAIIDDHNTLNMVDGKTGDVIGTRELDLFGAVWDLMAVPDISGDGVNDVIAFEFIDGGGGPDYGSIDAIDLVAAKVIWQVKTGDGLFYGGSPYSMTWLGEKDYFAVTQRVDNNLQLAVMDASTGDQIWQFDLGQEKSRSDFDKYYPVVRVDDFAKSSSDEIAVASIDSRLYLLDGADGSVIWSHPIGGVISGLAFAKLQGGQTYIVVEDQEEGVRALAGMTEIKTKLEIVASANTIFLSPLPDRVTVSGTLNPPFRGEVVELRYLDPAGKSITVPLLVKGDGSFSHVIEPEAVGAWKVMAHFEGEGYYLGSDSSTLTFTVAKDEVGAHVYKLDIAGSDVSYPISYQIQGGDIVSMSVNKQEKLLDLELSANDDGTLEIRLPRSVIDAWENSYRVYVDGKAADFREIDADPQFRTLSIPFSDSARHVEISGTYIVPEFSTMIVPPLTIAVVMIVATMYGRRFLKFGSL